MAILNLNSLDAFEKQLIKHTVFLPSNTDRIVNIL